MDSQLSIRIRSGYHSVVMNKNDYHLIGSNSFRLEYPLVVYDQENTKLDDHFKLFYGCNIEKSKMMIVHLNGCDLDFRRANLFIRSNPAFLTSGMMLEEINHLESFMGSMYADVVHCPFHFRRVLKIFESLIKNLYVCVLNDDMDTYTRLIDSYAGYIKVVTCRHARFLFGVAKFANNEYLKEISDDISSMERFVIHDKLIDQIKKKNMMIKARSVGILFK